MDTIETMREEFEVLQTELNRLKNENIELNQNARVTRIYRDEIDTLNFKLNKMEKEQQELERYKERCHEFDSLKNQIEELQNESKNIFLFSSNNQNMFDHLDKLLSQDRSHLERQIEGN
jgi:DNA repair exonuclease SbcCD ATPase subunit